jgi:NADPH2:quinone reductase
MRAIRIHETGDASVLRYETNVAVPQAKANEILVRNDFSGVNYIDTYHRTGLYKLPLPFVLGREAGGSVVALGSAVAESKEFNVGDKVGYFAQGSYAEYAAIDVTTAYKLPKEISTKTAAAIFLQGLTAEYLTTSSYKIKKGDNILIHAAAGGTGQLLTQIAKTLGATVIATVGSEDKAKIAQSNGADYVINYNTQDFLAEVQKITNNKLCAAVYDGVGATTWQKSLKSLARLGTLVLFGNASGPVPPINPLDLTAQGSVSLVRPSLKDYVATKEELQTRAEQLFQWISSGAVKLSEPTVFKLSEAADAHRALESRKFAGKILIDINAQ